MKSNFPIPHSPMQPRLVLSHYRGPGIRNPDTATC
nr:MAG TPA: hypothetical protein [Caudoviricetes sp.]